MSGAERAPASVWLLPSAGCADPLRGLIAELAARYHAPCFEPHVTLCVGEQAAGANWAELLAGCAAPPRSIELEVVGIGHSDVFFKTLYLQLRETAELHALAARAAAAVSGDGYRFAPHLSLLYQTLPESERARLVGELSAPGRIACDGLSLVLPSAQGWLDVAGWRSAARIGLG